MRVSREEAARNRERILDSASQLFRERGFDGIGVADVMKSVGLTHGGFYGHFSSKEDLIAQACSRAIARSLQTWAKSAETSPRNPMLPLARGYLSGRHRDDPGAGCLMAALGADAARQGPAVRHVVTEGLRGAFDLLARLIPGRSKKNKRQAAIGRYASWIGAMIMARAVDDRALSQEILEAVLASSAKS
ncbi:MAG: TetR/AcrR family transcriptional regulator [Burkholderiaceae bacterium]|nr:TetR/AcrR family transcriptional regulator [Burkholderiaceae bacterium]